MKAITSIKKAVKAIRKHGMTKTEIKGIHYHVNDFHKTPIKKSIVINLFEQDMLVKSSVVGSWFQDGYTLRHQSTMTDQQIAKYF